MPRKKDPPPVQPEDVANEADTSSLGQRVGAPHPLEEPEPRLPRMPHERDESAHATGERLKQDPVPSGREVAQALDDVEAGRVDTERKGIPDDVPGSKRNRES